MKIRWNHNKTYRRLSFALGILLLLACEKFVTVDPPITELNTAAVFQNDKSAISAMTGVYIDMMDDFGNFANKNTTLYAGLSADEFVNNSTEVDQTEVYENSLTPTNGAVSGLWNDMYKSIYQANAVLDGLESSISISDGVRDQLKGEALFIRAFGHFYLANFFGHIPYIITTDYQQNVRAVQEPPAQIYDLLVSDLLQAIMLLPDDYTTSNGERIRPNTYSAYALLARVYLYQQKWQQAAIAATEVIDHSELYMLSTDLDQVYTPNNNEAIWQLKPVINGLNTIEGYSFTCCVSSVVSLTSTLHDAFEPGDQRWDHWVASTTLGYETYYYPYKYKVTFADDDQESYTILRLAELYLIRAEARAHLEDIVGAQQDINAIRNRAGLEDTQADTQDSLLEVIEQENRIEFFAEWGHRWFDLKRTGKTDILATKLNWESTDALYPIPQKELLLNPNLEQNPGY